MVYAKKYTKICGPRSLNVDDRPLDTWASDPAPPRVARRIHVRKLFLGHLWSINWFSWMLQHANHEFLVVFAVEKTRQGDCQRGMQRREQRLFSSFGAQGSHSSRSKQRPATRIQIEWTSKRIDSFGKNDAECSMGVSGTISELQYLQRTFSSCYV